MYPFERFAQDAQQSLTFAQEEAERSHHSYIGTELAVARNDLANAVGETDYERASQVLKTVAKLAARLRSAEEEWLKTLGH